MKLRFGASISDEIILRRFASVDLTDDRCKCRCDLMKNDVRALLKYGRYDEC